MVILASNSPRRKELLSGLGIDFTVKVLKDIDESYPSDIHVKNIAEYIACKKASAYNDTEDIVITADTIVVVDDNVLGKPLDAADAHRMLNLLSGRTHQVITGVCIKTPTVVKHFSVSTDVTFKTLSDSEIDYYINVYKPYDKAGAYGIQEWIGYIGCTGLSGSYYNVMGLPVQRLYEELQPLLDFSFVSKDTK